MSPSAPVRRAPLAAALMAVALVLALPAWSATRFGYSYLSPAPGAGDVSRLNNIALRDGRTIDPASVADAQLSVVGSRSGAHGGRLVLSSDGKTLVFDPRAPFAAGEEVWVRTVRAPRTTAGATLAPVNYGFTVGREDFERPAASLDDELRPAAPGAAAAAPSTPSINVPPGLPASYPVTMSYSDHPDPGSVFVTPQGRVGTQTVSGLTIVDEYGYPFFYRRLPWTVFGFEIQPQTGLLTYGDATHAYFYGLDSTFAVVDSFTTGNGYPYDVHELLHQPDGSFWIMSYYTRHVGMDTVVAGGNPNAIVTETAIQKLDAARNVIFQWRTEDHFKITDFAYCKGLGLTAANVDYAHGNAIELDTDGNIIVSFRNLNELTKIDSQTGDVIWRFCPNGKNNQFTMLNDPRGFSDQHDVRRLPNGHLSLYNDGQCCVPAYSGGLEYEMDEVNMTASLVWSYRYTPDQNSGATGSTRRMANETIIGWGSVTTNPKATVLHADGATRAYELSYTSGFNSYRALKFPWKNVSFTSSDSSLDFGTVHTGDTATLPITVTNHTGADITVTNFYCPDSAFTLADPLPVVLPANGGVELHLTFSPTQVKSYGGPSYLRSIDGTTQEVVAERVVLSGVGDEPTATLLSLFDARRIADGVEVRFQFGEPGMFTSPVVERALSADGPWAAIAVTPSQDGSVERVIDRDADPATAYWYRLRATAAGGQPMTFAPFAVAAQALRFALTAPSPSRGPAAIAFTVGHDARVQLAVLDVQGRRVATLASGTYRAGQYSTTWSGARPGLYFVRFEWPEGRVVRRIAITN